MKSIIQIPILLFLLLYGNSLHSRTIRVATQKDYYPYSTVDSFGIYEGFLIDWWELWADKAGVDLEFIPGSTMECIDLVLEGKADVVSGLFFEEDGNEELEYSESIFSLNTTLFLKNGYNPKSIYEIDRPIGIIKNELAHQNLVAKYPDLTLKYFESFADLQRTVQNREVDGFIYDFPYPLFGEQVYSGAEGYSEYLVIRSDKIRPGVKKGNIEILNLLLTNSAKISNDELMVLIKNYDLYEEPTSYNWIIPIMVILVVFLSIGYLRLFRRQKRILNASKSINDVVLLELLKAGENDRVEFKSSLRWDYNQNQMNKALENVILKTIAAFLNTNGGTLIIGVDDSGSVLGLEKDYETVSKKSSDGFILTLTNLINQHLGKGVHKFISLEIVNHEDKDICTVTVSKCDGPVFLGKNDNETFFIRASASSQRLSVSEVVGYIKSHWKS
jgi:ABC-type amino acid transport substrate-binding protein